jgi:putative SOS response-associated peptidase YedK
MCGRYSLQTEARLLAEHFQLPKIPSLTPRFNIAPSQPVAIVRVPPAPNMQQAEGRELTLARWGLIPGWAKDPASGTQPINAKAETAAEKPMFRDALRRRRCLIPADGFYEWRREDMGKQPVYICMKDREPFAFAGLWEHWENQDGQAIESCTILTTEPNDLLKPIHNRMPVILDPKDYDLWLDPDVRDAGKVRRLLGPYPPADMTACPVSLRVNNPRNDDAVCIEPL